MPEQGGGSAAGLDVHERAPLRVLGKHARRQQWRDESQQTDDGSPVNTGDESHGHELKRGKVSAPAEASCAQVAPGTPRGKGRDAVDSAVHDPRPEVSGESDISSELDSSHQADEEPADALPTHPARPPPLREVESSLSPPAQVEKRIRGLPNPQPDGEHGAAVQHVDCCSAPSSESSDLHEAEPTPLEEALEAIGAAEDADRKFLDLLRSTCLYDVPWQVRDLLFTDTVNHSALPTECAEPDDLTEGDKIDKHWTTCPACNYELRSFRHMERQFHMRTCNPKLFERILREDDEFQAFVQYMEGKRITPKIEWIRCPICEFRPRKGVWVGFQKQFHMRSCDPSYFYDDLAKDNRFQNYLQYWQGDGEIPTISRLLEDDDDDDDEGDIFNAEDVSNRQQIDWRMFYGPDEIVVAASAVSFSDYKNEHKWCSVALGRGLYATENIPQNAVVHAIVSAEIKPMGTIGKILKRRRLPPDAAIQIGELGVLDSNIRNNEDLSKGSLKYCEWYAMNHHHNPNVRMHRKCVPGEETRVEWRTTREVAKGEELCYDYLGRGLKWMDEGWN